MPSKLLGMMASEKVCLVSGNSKSEVAKVLTPDTGFYISSIDPKEIYDKIIFLKDNPDLCSDMGKKARIKIIESFSKEKVLDNFIKKIDEIL